MSEGNNSGTGAIIAGACSIPAGFIVPVLGIAFAILGFGMCCSVSNQGKATIAMTLSILGMIVSFGLWGWSMVMD